MTLKKILFGGVIFIAGISPVFASLAGASSVASSTLSGPSTSGIPVNLSWTSVPRATQYMLFERTPPNVASWYPIFTGTTSTTYSQPNVSFGKSYEYRVNACDVSGVCSADSNYIAVSVVTGGPIATSSSAAPTPATTTTPSVSTTTATSSSTSSSTVSTPSSTYVAPPTPVYYPPASSTNVEQPVVTVNAEIKFKRNLKLGDRGSDVSALQLLLISEGVYKEAAVTGYFGPKTKAAVIKFQEKYKSEILVPAGLARGNGFIGALGRAKLNALFKKR